jgi:serine/threonine protein kinase
MSKSKSSSKKIPDVIGEGTYGCVHKPSLKCKDEPSMNYDNKVSKVLLSEDAVDELSEYEKVDDADKSADFYLGRPEECDIDNKNVFNLRAIQKCKIGSDVLADLENHSLIIMGNGGNNVDQYVKSMKKFPISQENKRTCELFLLESLRLFTGLLRFKEKDLVHHDLKPQNVVYNEEANRLNFIDFGLMQSKKKILDEAKKSKYEFSIFHWSFPWELLYLDKNKYEELKKKSELDRKSEFGIIIQKFVNRTDEKIPNGMHTFFAYALDPDIPRDEYRILRTAFFNDYYAFLNSVDRMDYTTFAEKSVDTIDSYGIGFTMKYWIMNAKKHLDKTFGDKLETFFYNMITPNLDRRLRIEDALREYEAIIHDSGLLEKYNKAIIDHLVKDAPKSASPKIKEIENFNFEKEPTSEFKGSPAEKLLNTAPPDYKPDEALVQADPGACPEGKERNPKTKRCINICKPGYSRNSDFKCVSNRRTAKRHGGKKRRQNNKRTRSRNKSKRN